MPIDDRAQRRPLDELHRHVVLPIDFAELVDLHDVAVREVGGELGFVDEELQPVALRRVLRMDDLERDPLGEPGGAELLGLVDGRHAAVRDLSQEAEGAGIIEDVVFARGFHKRQRCQTSEFRFQISERPLAIRLTSEF